MRIALNHQQEEFLRVVVGRSPELRDVDDLIRHALAAAEPRAPEPAAERGTIAVPPRRTRIVEHVIAPGTGKALVVRAGQVLRVSQIEGHQCADLNVFHLHQRRERLHTGHDELAMIIHADGQGSQPAKAGTWAALRQGAPDVHWGWKNFYDEDAPMLDPAQTYAVQPVPDLVTYQ